MERENEFAEALRIGGVAFTTNEQLAPHTTFHIGGPARFFVEPASTEQLVAVLKACGRCHIAPFPLGGGSNLLIRDDGVDGAVISFARMNVIRDEGGRMTAGSGCPLSRAVKESIDLGYGGMESLAGIPGCVGGAAVMNAGGKYGEIGPHIERVDVVTADGSPRSLERKDIHFSYRHSNLQGVFICEVILFLKRDASGRARELYSRIMEEKKNSQPLGAHNAGCMFKNPPGGKAGKMIDEAGLKGFRVGKTRISEVHANFVINEGGGTAGDVLEIIRTARERVRERFNVELETEVVIW